MEPQATHEEAIIDTLKEKLNIGMDEAKKIFHSIEDKLPKSVDPEMVLKVVRTYVTAHPVKSLLIAFALGAILTKMLKK